MDEMHPTIWDRLRQLYPRSLAECLAAGTFLLAVGGLFILDLNPVVLPFFLLPPFAATVHCRLSPRRSSRLVAAGFLVLLDVGIWIAPFGILFPHLHPLRTELSAHDSRILSWYLGICFFYLIAILPPFKFIRELVDYHHGYRQGFSRVTCVLGLITWFMVAPLLVAGLIRQLGLWPIIEMKP